ncbi:MAG TPA: 3-phosphoglycerate dehydrogenase [Tepidimicrobium sp.]|nr:3-phosphoglycerate dehydrogenase [Tepidimicrobium sp.]
MLKILITDGMEKTSLERLKKMNFHVVEQHCDIDTLKEEIKKFHVLVVRSATKVTKDVIDEAMKTKNLKLIIRAGVGLDNIDIEYAKLRGITVKNTPNASNTSVAELVIGHMFNIARFLHNSNITMRRGEWNKKKYQGIEIEGKTLGIIGFGRVGRELARKASALGMKIKFYDIVGPIANDERYRYCDLDQLLSTSDFVSLHVPHNQGDEALIGRKEISKMKDGAYLINCARGGVVDEEALIEALNSGKLAGAAVDVFVEEPTLNDVLCNHDKVSVTPHIGASTREAQRKIGDEVNKIILDFWKEREIDDRTETI